MKTMELKGQTTSGIWVMDKPVGPTSHDVVSFVRSRSRIQRVGHTGTLDPLGSGVLVLAVGKATRLIEYLQDDKEYEAEVLLGVTTDTYDAAGKVVTEKPVPPFTLAEIEAACARFRGAIQQVPPMVSAKRFQGQRLYDLARKGVEVERKPIDVTISKLQVLGWESPVVKLLVVCSTGTYVRSLAFDLGEVLGCGGHLKLLKRTRVGSFPIAQALSPEAWEAAWRANKASDHLIPMEKAVAYLPAIPVTYENAKVSLSGRPLMVSDEECPSLAGMDYFNPTFASLLLPDGSLFAVTKPRRKIRGWILKPEKIFRSEW